MAKKKPLPWWKQAWQHALGNPVAVIAGLLAIYSWYNSYHASSLADQRNSVIYQLRLDSSLARSDRFPQIEWRLKRLAKTDSIYRERHPELYDSITFIR